jgi:hypothetical protein
MPAKTCRAARTYTSEGQAMVNWIALRNEESEVFVESTNVEELRARRVWKFLLVTWLTWLANGIFLWCRGYHVAAAVCLIDFLAHLDYESEPVRQRNRIVLRFD